MSTYDAYCQGPEGWGHYRASIDTIGRMEFEPLDGEAEYVLVPGFVDVHIHGSNGLDFMSASTAEISDLADHLVDLGYEYWLPTTITGSLDATQDAIDRLPTHPSILGFHLEGPFISPDYPGAQPCEAIVRPNSDWDRLLDDPRLRLITLAPEVPGVEALIQKLSARGVVVSMGHTNCTYAQAARGFASGVTHATHTFNAMRPFHHREAGAVGFALTNDNLYAEIIYDRIHVSPDAARLLLACKPQDKIIGISDGSMAAGLAPGTQLDMWGHRCLVGNGEVRLASNGALAGSAVTLRDVFVNLAVDFGVEVATAWCCVNPRTEQKLISPPKRYLLLDRQFQIVKVISC